MEKSSSIKETKNIPSFVAKHSFEIHHNDVHLKFEKGKKYSGIDKKWKPTLTQEKII